MERWEKENGEIDWNSGYNGKGTSYIPFKNGRYAAVSTADKNEGVVVLLLYDKSVKTEKGERSALLSKGYIIGGQVVATQTPEEASSGRIMVNGKSYFVNMGNSKSIEEALAKKEGGRLELYGTKEEAELAAKDVKAGVKPMLVMEVVTDGKSAGIGSGYVKTTEPGIFTDTEVKKVMKDGKVASEEMMYNDFGIAGKSGTIQEIGADGKPGRLLQTDTSLKSGVPVSKDLYFNGAKVGAEHYGDDGKLVYSWKKNADGKTEVTYVKDGKEETRLSTEEDIPDNIKNKVSAEEKEAQQQQQVSKDIVSVYKVLNQLKSYPAISQALWGDSEWYINWRDNADRAFAPMLGSSWFPSAVCDEEGYKRDIEQNEGVAFVKTPSGTYQAVASVKGERTKELSPLLCARNPDETAKELFICDEGQVCGEDQLCYAADENGEVIIPKGKKSAEPLQGYMYKISWAVTAPGDEKLTPFVTEKGAAISFNIVVEKGDGTKRSIYNSPIELKNGEHDADVMTHFEKDASFSKVCIVWDKSPVTTPSPFNGFLGGAGGTAGALGTSVGGTVVMGTGSVVAGGALSAAGGAVGFGRLINNMNGGESGREAIPMICSAIKDTAVGTVKWEHSGDGAKASETSSPTVSSGKIGKKASWG